MCEGVEVMRNFLITTTVVLLLLLNLAALVIPISAYLIKGVGSAEPLFIYYVTISAFVLYFYKKQQEL